MRSKTESILLLITGAIIVLITLVFTSCQKAQTPAIVDNSGIDTIAVIVDGSARNLLPKEKTCFEDGEGKTGEIYKITGWTPPRCNGHLELRYKIDLKPYNVIH